MIEKYSTVADNLYIRLLDFLYNCSKLNTDFYIARSLLMNLHSFPEMTIQEVADFSFTTKTSVTKFCKKLGYNNFHEMRFAIEKTNAKESFFNNTTEILKETKDVHESINTFMEDTQKLDKEIFASFDYVQISKICQLLGSAKSIALIFPTFTFESGNLFKELLHSLGINVFIVKRSLDMSVISEMIGSVDLAIISSMTGKWVTDFKDALFAIDSEVILVTTDLNQEIEDQRDCFKEVVELKRRLLKRSNYVSSRIFVNYFTAIYLEFIKNQV